MLAFSKYTGCGNDFILIDDRTETFPTTDLSLIGRLCDRKKGVGADGVILLKNSAVADFRMHIFNSDGSEAEMCGNGMRCLGRFILELGFPKKRYSIETTRRLLSLDFPGECAVCVEMGDPTDMEWDVSLEEMEGHVHYLDTGVPHVVFFTEDLTTLPFLSIGQTLRHHPRFQPRGANVNAVRLLDAASSRLAIRTFERGVEGETQACGTGATAAAIVAHRVKGLKAPVTVELASKETLTIHFTPGEKAVSAVTMEGPAEFVFSGTVNFM